MRLLRINHQLENPELFKAQVQKNKQWKKENPTKCVSYSTKWNANNKDKRNATRRARYAKNKEAEQLG